MGLSIRDFKTQIVRPTLEAVGWGGTTAVNLVTGTAMVESDLYHLVQLNGGPARSIFQIEEPTFNDWSVRWLALHPADMENVRKFAIGGKLTFDQLPGNLYLATLACRGKYKTISAPLPANNAEALSNYHKKYYNTDQGKANATVNIEAFRVAIGA